MKRQILNAAITLSVIAAMSIAGFAGLIGNLEANIPFDFMVNGKKLPAGKYIVGADGASKTLAIRNWKSRQGAFSLTHVFQVRDGSKPELVFHRYGDQYFLAKVISDTSGIELPKTKAEREAAKAKRDLLTMKAITMRGCGLQIWGREFTRRSVSSLPILGYGNTNGVSAKQVVCQFIYLEDANDE